MRSSGILLHMTSLPSRDGIGSLGKSAHRFVDFLHAAGMGIWQMLPVSPTGYGESPYQCFSTFAGNPLLIDLEMLEEEGILLSEDRVAEPRDPETVDYPAVIRHKDTALRLAFSQSGARLKRAVSRFCTKEAHWIRDYALFMAVKKHFGLVSWMDWPDEAIRMRKPEAVRKYADRLSDEVAYQRFVQYLFFRQWKALKKHASRRGIRLFGDLPIYVAMDSADAWSHAEIFQLDRRRHRPLHVAGVPPDYFSADGQLWGNPLYNWKRLRETGYEWWIRRLSAMACLFDLVRVDHFIGFANYYSVRYGESTARNGQWKLAPGRDFFRVVRQQLPGLNVVAEDLGAVNERVARLLKSCGCPGMRVVTFGFSGGDENGHLPANHPRHSVAYTGTHDNNTILGWWNRAREDERTRAAEVLGLTAQSDVCEAIIRATLASRADTAIIPMQDILKLPERARMNTPSTLSGNWLWRMREDALSPRLAHTLRALNALYDRGPSCGHPEKGNNR